MFQMKGTRSFLILTITTLLVFNSILFAQETEKERSFGITAVIQGSHFDISLPIWTSEGFVVAPSFYLASVEDSQTRFGTGVAFKKYKHIDDVSPYFGGRLVAAFVNLSRGDEFFADYVAGIFAGGEYFFHHQFSIGIEGQLNATFSDKQSVQFGNPGKMTINTGTIITANIYF
ncbi:MAG: hypothetical protein D8M58_16235 [Calditrichaeota bacterium]|nr:MAG: hypothetical protein DWQ03_07965 [Calditrichota bacterium]MBL1206955.1 hypothetical protein [Calditrichota bacterium]NOG46782.1 hypothetical protein [Calditrichota bacterium]